VAILLGRAVKSIQGYADEFQLRLSESVAEFFNRQASAAEVGSVLKNLLRGYARDTYLEGMREGGVDEPESDITDEEEADISAWVSEQFGFVPGFVQAVKDTRTAEDNESAQAGINNRVELWAGSLANLGSLGKARALANIMCTWVYGDTEHCATCEKLNGRRKRMSWFLDNGYIPQENGSDTLECGGWRCQCKLVNDKGKQVMP
jgi:hypothetical protein